MENNRALYKSILLSDTPLIDLRSPGEFAQGAFPSSQNMPLLSDEERCLVGTCYKQKGQQAAILLGHQLVEHDLPRRIERWASFKKNNPKAWLYCLRGGLRSRLTVDFLKEIGVDIELVPGGYKAIRRFLIDKLNIAPSQKNLVLGGYTGSGKTLLIQSLENGLDIEGRSHHRGSSFGKKVQQQPTQISYENQLSIDLVRIYETHQSIVMEDESKFIGRILVPLGLFKTLTTSPIVVIKDPFEIRLARLQIEYCDLMKQQYQDRLGEKQGWIAYNSHLLNGLFGIRKRLGSERYIKLTKVLNHALEKQISTGDTLAHQDWIAPLLKNYYDPMYEYQLQKKAHRIVFTGDHESVKNWLISQNSENECIKGGQRDMSRL
ncbi:MAG: tRNA 2-selenouridine(34) synthase MnmH [Psychromonas sp.]|nr:tRNA 2-selenouridine(34) synthase MnmH [Psychromonas sp.]